jgi:hypothetical protein
MTDNLGVSLLQSLLSTLSGLIQWALRIVEMWCDELGLSVIAFTRKR